MYYRPTGIIGRFIFGVGNLGLKIVAMSALEVPSQNQLRTYGGQTARANMRSPIIHYIGRFFRLAGPSDTTHWIQNNSNPSQAAPIDPVYRAFLSVNP